MLATEIESPTTPITRLSIKDIWIGTLPSVLYLFANDIALSTKISSSRTNPLLGAWISTANSRSPIPSLTERKSSSAGTLSHNRLFCSTAKEMSASGAGINVSFKTRAFLSYLECISRSFEVKYAAYFSWRYFSLASSWRLVYFLNKFGHNNAPASILTHITPLVIRDPISPPFIAFETVTPKLASIANDIVIEGPAVKMNGISFDF